MTGKPSRPTLDSVDEHWDEDDDPPPKTLERRVHPRGRSPARAGTMPWDDRTLPILGRGEAPRVRGPSPTRSGTLSLDELLPKAVKHLREEDAAASARAARPVRGGTRSWDDMLAELREEARVARGDAPDAPADPFDDLPPDLIAWLSEKR